MFRDFPAFSLITTAAQYTPKLMFHQCGPLHTPDGHGMWSTLSPAIPSQGPYIRSHADSGECSVHRGSVTWVAAEEFDLDYHGRDI